MSADYSEEHETARHEWAEPVGRNTAERRIRLRARELKRALMESTVRLPHKRDAAGDHRAVRGTHREGGSGSPFLRYLLVLLIGATSMLIPVDSTCTLRGQLKANDTTEAAEGNAPVARAVVYAQPAQCAMLAYNQLAAVAIDAPGQGSALYQAETVQLTPHTKRAGVHVCQIELELLPLPDEPDRLRDLPSGAALSATFPTQPRSWLAALVDQVAGDGKLGETSIALRAHAQTAWQYARGLVHSALHDTELGRKLRATLAGEDEED